MIGIISVGLGNVGSISNMLGSCGFKSELLASPPMGTDRFDSYILPGVGSFDSGMEAISRAGWSGFLRSEFTQGAKRSFLVGICLGMQLLCDGSDEGDLPGLGLIPGCFRKFSGVDPNGQRHKVPHMGWNTVQFDQQKAPWATNLPDDPRFYFVHSYHYTASNDDYVIGMTNSGEQFASVIAGDRVIGFQFHPEKSHRFGKALLGSLFQHIEAQKSE